MLSIWKTELLRSDVVQYIAVPLGAEFLTAREQGEKLCIWYRCDRSAPMTRRKILVIETGQQVVPPLSVYVGTAMFVNGHYVLHVFAEN
jgi:hypothetical protein